MFDKSLKHSRNMVFITFNQLNPFYSCGLSIGTVIIINVPKELCYLKTSSIALLFKHHQYSIVYIFL